MLVRSVRLYMCTNSERQQAEQKIARITLARLLWAMFITLIVIELEPLAMPGCALVLVAVSSLMDLVGPLQRLRAYSTSVCALTLTTPLDWKPGQTVVLEPIASDAPVLN